jgi:hypothetical protein
MQGVSSQEKEIQEKYKEGETESEESRYEKKYKRKIESLCEGEWFSVIILFWRYQDTADCLTRDNATQSVLNQELCLFSSASNPIIITKTTSFIFQSRNFKPQHQIPYCLKSRF